jgi:hypothetical protein
MKPDGSQFKPIVELAIIKNTVHFRRAEEIDPEHDPDAPVLGMGRVKSPLSAYGKSQKRKRP